MEIISIIVPIYKVEGYLDKCITSLVNQTYKNLEIILVDDGSPDNCGAICDAWADRDSRIKVIHKSNGGLSDARNAGLEVTTGEYVAFVDSDDWVELNYYEVLYKQLCKYNAKIAASGVIWAYEDHEEISGTRFATKSYNSEEALYTIQNNEGFLAVAWNKLYARELFQKIRYPYGRIHEDEFVTYRVIAEAENLVLCQDVNYYYRQREGSIMAEPDCEKEVFVLDAYLERISMFRERYPELFLKDKCIFCLTCCYIFQLAKRQKNKKVMRQVVKKRREISFTVGELCKCTKKEKFYAVGTEWTLSLFCNVLQWRNKNYGSVKG